MDDVNKEDIYYYKNIYWLVMTALFQVAAKGYLQRVKTLLKKFPVDIYIIWLALMTFQSDEQIALKKTLGTIYFALGSCARYKI